MRSLLRVASWLLLLRNLIQVPNEGCGLKRAGIAFVTGNRMTSTLNDENPPRPFRLCLYLCSQTRLPVLLLHHFDTSPLWHLERLHSIPHQKGILPDSLHPCSFLPR